MRRAAILLTIVAALGAASQAAARFQPIRRSFGELTIPRLRAGTVQIPKAHDRGTVRVIVRLRQPPLAAVFGRSLQMAGESHRLDVQSRSSQAYLARIDAMQRRAAAALERAIPGAKISRRFQIILDGLTVTLPIRKLPRLVRLGFVTKVYPSYTYFPTLNESPSIISADLLHQRTGAMGDGVKIGVVDTGIDETNPFLNADGMSYPPGFPKGGKKWTTPKVIVARAFPGPGSGRSGRLAVNPLDPHGTHVSGIAAGRAGTSAPGDAGYPPISGLSGVAPKAWLGNYRVFTIPTPLGNVADTPEIVAAFEAAVRDGMDVINFSGGGSQYDPANDALVEAVRNVSNAGVVPVIAAGNDHDDFGDGSVGSPGTAPDAISVAAVTNSHVFAPVLRLDSPTLPGLPKDIAFEPGLAPRIPAGWSTLDQPIVDVGTIVGTDGSGVDRYVCGSPEDPNGSFNPLPPGSLTGQIALVSRGFCSFVSKSIRVKQAGAIGMILVNNRAGNPSGIPVVTAVPAGMVSDLDGQRLRNALASSSGRGLIRIDTSVAQINDGRSGIVTYFSSSGPTDFGHELKPDVSAPGGQILSSVPEAWNRSGFAVFDGTSMATPHVAGAAALLVELHPGWTAQEIKSALVSTAGPAWANTARTVEAPVTYEGGGLINVNAAADPDVFTNPTSLSYGDLDVNHSAARRALLVEVSDAGGGGGTWQVSLQPQSATFGATLDFPSSVTLPPGGDAELPVVAKASAGASAGDDYGFIVLTNGSVTRRIPYLFLVTRPAFERASAKQLKKFQTGSTRFGPSRANVYRFPTWAFGPPPNYNSGPPMNEGGAEKLYTTLVKRPVYNLGVSVIEATTGSEIDPWFLGSEDQNNVQGYTGLPVNVNNIMFDFHFDIGAAGVVFPRQQRFYVAVDSGSDPFTGRQLPGNYLLKYWINDITPPTVKLLTTRVAAGRPLLVAKVLDSGAGVDPLSLVIGYHRVLVGAAAFDPISGLALFPLPKAAPVVRTGPTRGLLIASDFQETKNIATVGQNLEPNTTFKPVTIQGVEGPAVTWLIPQAGACVRGRTRLAVAAASNKKIVSVRFFDGTKPISTVTNGPGGLYLTDWRTQQAKAAPGRHTLRAVALDAAGKSFAAVQPVRVCT